MPRGVQETTNIPKEKVPEVVAGYMLDQPPPMIEKIEQPDGLWTVRATYPNSSIATAREVVS